MLAVLCVSIQIQPVRNRRGANSDSAGKEEREQDEKAAGKEETNEQ